MVVKIVPTVKYGSKCQQFHPQPPSRGEPISGEANTTKTRPEPAIAIIAKTDTNNPTRNILFNTFPSQSCLIKLRGVYCPINRCCEILAFSFAFLQKKGEFVEALWLGCIVDHYGVHS
jgi:hypothetical protein